jgi:hypothetical protein
MSEENVERVRTVYEQWAKGNFRAGGELFDDDVVFRTFEAIADAELHGQWRQDPGRDAPVWPRKAQRSGG